MNYKGTIKDTAGAPSFSSEELQAMLERYKIGKKPLARLLGWGETALIIYGKDGFSDNGYSAILHEINDNPAVYAEILMNNRDRISSIAYRKSFEAVCAIFPLDSIGEAALYVNEYLSENAAEYNDDGISLLRLETILFWSQVISLCLYGKPLFDEDYHPLKNCLPYRSVEDRTVRYGCIRPLELYPKDNLLAPTTEEREILSVVGDIFSWYGSKALAGLQEAEYHRLCGPRSEKKRRSASVDILRKCYNEVFEQAKVRKLKDFEGYIFKRINYLLKNS